MCLQIRNRAENESSKAGSEIIARFAHVGLGFGDNSSRVAYVSVGRD